MPFRLRTIQAALELEAERRGVRVRRFRRPVWLLLPLAVADCGRIPGLDDAATRRRADAQLADAASPDGRRDMAADRKTDGRSDSSDRTTNASGGSMTGGVAASGGAWGSPGDCSSGVVLAAKDRPADVLLVLDRSGSMTYNIDDECSCDPTANPLVVCSNLQNCITRWASLGAAVDATLLATPDLHWGLKLFPSAEGGPCAVSSTMEVPVGATAARTIEARIASTAPAGETPTALAVSTATAYLQAKTDPGTKMILLATDGKPNCGGAPPSVYEDDVAGSVDAVAAAYAAGFLVYVVGIGTGASAANLDAYAQAGGTRRHYPAESFDALTKALASIGKAASCTFTLTQRPPDRQNVALYVDNALVRPDATDGWSFGADAQTVQLHGKFCEQVLAKASSTVAALFTCGQPPPSALP